MKDTIILFDIDGTLFDPEKYLTNVFLHIAENLHISENIFLPEAWDIFTSIRKKSLFTPVLFSKEVAKRYKTDEKLIEKFFWGKSFFTEAIFIDVMPALEKLVKIAKIGVLSTGETAFQKAKIASIQHALAKDSLHIFSAKEKELIRVLHTYKDKNIYLVDDKEEILHLAKNIYPELKTFLIERGKKGNSLKKRMHNIPVISSLNDLPRLLSV